MSIRTWTAAEPFQVSQVIQQAFLVALRQAVALTCGHHHPRSRWRTGTHRGQPRALFVSVERENVLFATLSKGRELPLRAFQTMARIFFFRGLQKRACPCDHLLRGVTLLDQFGAQIVFWRLKDVLQKGVIQIQ
ncbi:hypothetical protein MBRA_05061 [Methylobacterium brachiatum]|nr:hypothetical protein MBRA_05061 [Methylobacterium brachiatum]